MFQGRPSAPPDVYSKVMGSDEDNTTATLVHVSWNGATEVASWNLYKADDHGDINAAELVTTLPRSGFETALTYSGVATYVIVEGVDREGTILGRSHTVKSDISADLSPMTVAQEAQWLYEMRYRRTGGSSAGWLSGSFTNKPGLVFWLGVLFGMLVLMGSKAVWRANQKGAFAGIWRQRQPWYRLVSQHDESEKMRE